MWVESDDDYTLAFVFDFCIQSAIESVKNKCHLDLETRYECATRG